MLVALPLASYGEIGEQ